MDKMPFGIDETHGMLLQPGVQISTSSVGREWTSLFVSQQKEPPFQGSFRGTKDPFFLLIRQGKERLKSFNGSTSKVRVGAGSILMHPPGSSISVQLEPDDAEIETVHVYVRREVVEEVAMDMVDCIPSRADPPTQVVGSDPVMQSLLETSVRAAQDDVAGSPLFADFLSRAIASHWIGRYSEARIRTCKGESLRGKNAKSLAEAIDYLKTNIDKSVSLEDIGRAVNRSASQISRMFSTELGMPPHQYLMRLRFERAQKLLVKTSMPIAEIAYDCGLSHQEHLSRMFRRFANTTPAAYRREARG